MNRILLLVLFVLACVCYGKAQMPVVLSDKIALQESQIFKNKSAFNENKSSAKTDFIYQRMEWEIDPEIRYISGKITTYFKSQVPALNEVYFDLSETLQVDSVIQNNQNIEFTHKEELVTIPLLTELSENQIDSVCFYYHGIPPESGFGSFTQTTHGEDKIPILWTLSEPYGAKEWWPCKQSLTDKIDSIDVIVRSPEVYRTASNGLLVSETINHGKRIMHWKHRFPIATYLVAVAVTNYASYSDYLDLNDDRKIEILNYVYPENLAKAKTQTPITAELIELYNTLIGEYPFASEKYGHAQFGWGGGMEHQTMSFMGNFSFGLIAHELAHQWFGDCITLGSWQHIWLNEGFATYLTGLAHEELAEPQWWPIWKKEYKNKVLSQPDGSVFVQDTASISRLFSSRLSYAKGGFLLHMQRWILGDEMFFTALKNYFADEKIANGFAFTQDWIQHIEAVGDTTFTKFFNDWFYGEGYPIYSINYQQSSPELLSLELSQTTSHESVDFFEMPVPIRVYGNNKTDSANFRLNNTTNHQQFVLNPGFIVEEIVIDPDDRILCKSDQIVSTPLISKQNEVRIYPNPATNKVTVFVPSGQDVVQIRIYSIDGKCEKLSFGKTNEIDLSKLQEGVYLVQIGTLNSVFNQKIIKQ